MSQILSDEAVILYDPIQTTFDVHVIGGSITQQQDMFTGQYDPDRSRFPIMLVPSLLVTDPNTGRKGVEDIDLCLVNWYLVAANGTETEITSTDTINDDYAIDGKSLVIHANIAAGQVLSVAVQVQYPNASLGNNMKFRRKFTLSTSAMASFDPMLSLDIPNLATVNPFHLGDAVTRTITASFFAGKQDISTHAKVVYVWEIWGGSAYRAITAEDVEVDSVSTRSVVIGGVATTVQYRTIVLRLECIKQLKIRCTAYHADIDAAQFRQSAVFTVDRKMYGARPMIKVTKGKHVKGDTLESEAEFSLAVNSNLINNPMDFFCVRWKFFRLSGTSRQNEVDLGWGQSAKATRAMIGTDKTKKPTFEGQAYSLGEFALLEDDNGDIIEDDDSTDLVIGQYLEDKTYS